MVQLDDQRSVAGATLTQLTPIESSSIAGLAYEQIRALILSGEMAPGARLSQLELAERLAISRTPVREALRRLAGEGLVDALPQRGFRVADLGLDSVMRRLEVRQLLEPGIARVAAQHATPKDVAALREAIAQEERAEDVVEVHDSSRSFHINLARATHNDELVNILDSMWIIEVGRRLLARRAFAPRWRAADISEHTAIADAVERRDAEEAEALMREHIGAAVQHWNETAPRGEH
jgi:DNA-binding GntR family transcriptional regulator